jgi:hypothetical protein
VPTKVAIMIAGLLAAMGINMLTDHLMRQQEELARLEAKVELQELVIRQLTEEKETEAGILEVEPVEIKE